MLKLLEVKTIPEDISKAEMLARLDVTENTEAERQEILDNTRILYPGCAYYWHDCGHDIGEHCSVRGA